MHTLFIGVYMRVIKLGSDLLSNTTELNKACKYIKQLTTITKVVIVVSGLIAELYDYLEKKQCKHLLKQNLREADVLMSTVTTISASILALKLENAGVNAVSVQGWQIGIKTFGQHTKSCLTSINKNKINKYMSKNNVLVVAGNQGVNNYNNVTTLNENGVDIVAVAIGIVLNCEVELLSSGFVEN